MKTLQAKDIDSTQEVAAESPVKVIVAQTRDLVGGKVVLSDRDYVLRFAEAVDWAVFRNHLEAKAKVRPSGWRTLPNGLRISADRILMLCTNAACNAAAWFEASSAGGACLVCNPRRLKTGGHRRVATKQEEAAWLAKAQAAHERYLAEAPKRRKETADANKARFYAEGLGAPATDIFRRRP